MTRRRKHAIYPLQLKTVQSLAGLARLMSGAAAVVLGTIALLVRARIKSFETSNSAP
jgi:hypothetical protein